MRVLITGSRTWPDPTAVTTVLDRMLDHHDRLTLVHGGCPTGVDATADQWASEHPDTVTVEVHRADWDRHGKAAGPIRNTAMVTAGADRCVAFIYRNSPGASQCAQAAQAAGIPTILHHGYVLPNHPAPTPTPESEPAVVGPAPAAVEANPFLVGALDAAGHGWPVFPIRPGMKRPAVTDWENRATTDPERITRCWAAGPYNIGIACGPAGLVVVDLDPPKPDEEAPPVEWRIPGVGNGQDVLAVLADRAGQPLPFDTRLVRTGRGGLHAYYTPPTGVELRNTSKKLGPWIDTRAAGGYVLAPGSKVNGHRYELLHEAPVEPLPGWLAELLTPAPTPPARLVTVALGSGTGRKNAFLQAAIDGETRRVATAPPGQHNHTLYTAAIALGQLVAGGALDETTARAVLADASARRATTARCDCTEREAHTTITSGLKAGARRPRQVAA